MMIIIPDLLEEPITLEDNEAIRKAKTFYNTCMDICKYYNTFSQVQPKSNVIFQIRFVKLATNLFEKYQIRWAVGRLLKRIGYHQIYQLKFCQEVLGEFTMKAIWWNNGWVRTTRTALLTSSRCAQSKKCVGGR